LVVSTSAINCLERLVPEMTYYVSSRTLNRTHSLTFSGYELLHCFYAIINLFQNRYTHTN